MNLFRNTLLLMVLSVSVAAQVRINPEAIGKLLLFESSGGLSGSWQKSYEVLHEGGSWKSYRLSVNIPMITSKAVTRWYEREKSIERKQVATVSTAMLRELLNALASPVVSFDWKTIPISAATLDHYSDTTSRYSYINQRWGKKLSRFYTEENLRNAILALQDKEWTDFGQTSRISIILKSGDTLNVVSNRQPDFMLPWMVAGKPNYSLAINRFFAASADPDHLLSNVPQMTGAEFPASVSEHIYQTTALRALFEEEWDSGFPDSKKRLTDAFNVGRYTIDQGFYRCNLRSVALPANFVIDAMIDLRSIATIDGMIRFRDSIRHFVDQGNFIFRNYPPVSGATFTFPRERNTAPTRYITEQILKKNLPILAEYDLKQSIYFQLSSRESVSDWLILPDQKLLLLNYSGSAIVGIAPSTLLSQGQSQHYPGGFFHTDTDKYSLFSPSGELLAASKIRP